MNETERTTIRIKKYLLKEVKDMAYIQDKPLQDVFNDILIKGLATIGHVGQNTMRKTNALKKLEEFRTQLADKDIDLTALLDKNRKDLL